MVLGKPFEYQVLIATHIDFVPSQMPEDTDSRAFTEAVQALWDAYNSDLGRLQSQTLGYFLVRPSSPFHLLEDRISVVLRVPFFPHGNRLFPLVRFS